MTVAIPQSLTLARFEIIFVCPLLFFWLLLSLGFSTLSCLKGDRNTLSGFSCHSFILSKLNTPSPRGHPIQADWPPFLVLHVIACFFTNWGFMGVFYRWKFYGSPHQASLSAPFFQQHLFTLCLCVTFGNSCNVSVIFIIFLFVMVICDQWSLMLLLEFGVWAP